MAVQVRVKIVCMYTHYCIATLDFCGKVYLLLFFIVKRRFLEDKQTSKETSIQEVNIDVNTHSKEAKVDINPYSVGTRFRLLLTPVKTAAKEVPPTPAKGVSNLSNQVPFQGRDEELPDRRGRSNQWPLHGRDEVLSNQWPFHSRDEVPDKGRMEKPVEEVQNESTDLEHALIRDFENSLKHESSVADSHSSEDNIANSKLCL